MVLESLAMVCWTQLILAVESLLLTYFPIGVPSDFTNQSLWGPLLYTMEINNWLFFSSGSLILNTYQHTTA